MDRKSLEFHKKKFDAYKNANPPMYRAMEYETVIIESMRTTQAGKVIRIIVSLVAFSLYGFS